MIFYMNFSYLLEKTVNFKQNKFNCAQSYLVEFLVQVQAENMPYDLGRVQPALEFDSELRIRLGQAEYSTQLYEQIIKFSRA